jgi:hypothetical protein
MVVIALLFELLGRFNLRTLGEFAIDLSEKMGISRDRSDSYPKERWFPSESRIHAEPLLRSPHASFFSIPVHLDV